MTGKLFRRKRMLKKLALYPMTYDLCTVARYAFLLQGYTVSSLLVPKSWMLNGLDISKIDGGEFANMPLYDFSNEQLNACDAIYMDYSEEITNLDVYRNIILAASERNKEVLLSRKLTTQLTELCDTAISQDNPMDEKLHQLDVPVIMVLAQGERVGQYAIELALRNHFITKGYAVSQIASYDIGRLFGMHSIPDFIYRKGEAYDKIVMFNHFASNLVFEEKPEILIVGVPGAVMKYSDKHLQGLGILPLIITSAVRSDASVFCTYYNESLKTYLEETRNYCNYRLDCNTFFFGISNTVLELDVTDVKGQLKYITLDTQSVLEGIQKKKMWKPFTYLHR